MDLSISVQSLKNVVRFPFQDPQWATKLLIGSGLLFLNYIVPVAPAIPVLGYYARLIRAGARNDDPSRLPEWDDWGELFLDGLRLLGVILFTTLPGMLVILFGMAVYFGSAFTLVAQSSMYPYRDGPGMGFFLSLLVMLVTVGIGTVLLILGIIVMLPAEAHVAVKRRFGVFFAFGEWWGVLRKNLLGYLVVLLVVIALYTLLNLVVQLLYMTLIFCVLIPFAVLPLSMYMGVVLYRLVGQVYGEAAGGEAAAAIEPTPEAPEPPLEPAI